MRPMTIAGVFALVVVLPSLAHAQASITGVIKDTSGAILPGLTVEAASPALSERVRSADGGGQYRIVDLRPTKRQSSTCRPSPSSASWTSR